MRAVRPRALVLDAAHGINYRDDSSWSTTVAELTGGSALIIETGAATSPQVRISARS